jgi:hypothetical protein
VLQAVSEFIERHGDSRFSALHDENSVVRDRAGYWRTRPDGSHEYLFNSAGLKEATTGFDFNYALGVLKDAGWLKPGTEGDGKSSKQIKVSGIKDRFYIISAPDDADEVPPVPPGENGGGTNGDQAECRGTTGTTGTTEKENKATENKNARDEEDGWEVH